MRDANHAARAPLQWAFGAGGVGQTFVFEHENAVRESRVSVFGATGALGFTPARALNGPVPLADAIGRGLHRAGDAAEGAKATAGRGLLTLLSWVLAFVPRTSAKQASMSSLTTT